MPTLAQPQGDLRYRTNVFQHTLAKAIFIVGDVFAYACKTALCYMPNAMLYSVGRFRLGLASAPYIDNYAVRSGLGIIESHPSGGR